MKKLIIGLLVIGFTNLSLSQTATPKLADIDFSEVIISPLNISYLNEVLDETTPQSVTFLENKASRFNIKTSNVYDNNHDIYEITFTQSNGKIIAYYDNSGKIIRCSEKFKNVKIPLQVRATIFKDNPGWVLHSDTYLVSYKYGDEARRIYKIQLRKGKQKKNIKIDNQGNIM